MQDHYNQDGWEDEPTDVEWVKIPIMINVPFHRWKLHPGQEQFKAGILYHHKLVSVIWEIFQLAMSTSIFLWQSSESLGPVRVHRELYVLEAFVSAHCVSSLLSVMLNYGLSIWSWNIDRPNHPAMHSNILLILRWLEKIISCILWILTSLFDSFHFMTFAAE
jgi:hypothetical protein